MAACDLSAQILDTRCLAPQISPILGEQMMIVLLCQILQALDSMATCDYAELADQAQDSGFLCLQPNQKLGVIAQLLCEINASLGGGGGGGAVMFRLHGVGSPEGVVVGYLGQLYQNDTDGTQFRFTGTDGTMVGWV